MTLRAYFDESIDPAEKVIAIGGFIGREGDWNSLERTWTNIVKPTGVSAYHMTDCECGYGEFSPQKGWTKDRRNTLTRDLIDLIVTHNILLIGATMLLEEYRDIPLVDKSTPLGGDH